MFIFDFDVNQVALANNNPVILVNKSKSTEGAKIQLDNNRFLKMFYYISDNDTKFQLFNEHPNRIATRYAKENNISLEEAKNSLREKYGEPKMSENKPDPSISPNEYAKIFAKENKISVKEAKVILLEMYGTPEKLVRN